MPASPLPFAADLTVIPEVAAFFDEATNTISYIVRDTASLACAVIDPVLDFDPASASLTHDGAERIIAHIRQRGWTLEWLIETHLHADHLSASSYIQSVLGGRIGIGEQVRVMQQRFGALFNEGADFRRDGSQFDHLFGDGDSYRIGTMTAHTLFTPGHTAADMVHVMGNAAFVGDTLFMPDGGTARADLPGGDARTLYRSIQRILALPPAMRLFMCHDYGPDGRDFAWETTVADERAHNIHVGHATAEDAFVALREARDRTLPMPGLILPALQVNMRAGQLPPADPSGQTFLKVPVNALPIHRGEQSLE